MLVVSPEKNTHLQKGTASIFEVARPKGSAASVFEVASAHELEDGCQKERGNGCIQMKTAWLLSKVCNTVPHSQNTDLCGNWKNEVQVGMVFVLGGEEICAFTG